MKTEIYITEYTGRLLTCLYEDNRLCEVWLEPAEERILPGDIYIGKVKNILKNLNAAFVEIRPGVMGYYSMTENSTHHFVNNKKNDIPVSGDELLVQVSGEKIKSKEWPLSSDICIQGNAAVYFPWRNENRISKKIKDDQEKARLTELLEKYACRYSGGWTLRTAAREMSDGDIVAEMDRLAAAGNDILAVCRSRTCYSRLHGGDCIWKETARRYAGDAGCIITTDDEKIYDELLDMFTGIHYEITESYGKADMAVTEDHSSGNVQTHGSVYFSGKANTVHESGRSCPEIRLYEDRSYPIVKLKGIETLIDRAMSKKVWLPSGGYLVIEQTEAMSVIDVNTGKNIRRGNSDELFMRTNMEALDEAFRQVRVRNLSGMIVIDLINMRSRSARSELISYARALAFRDPVQTNVIDMTGLQLLEITRRKSRRSLPEMLRKA